MARFKEYIASGGSVGEVPAGVLDEMAARWPWFTVVRMVRAVQTGRADVQLTVSEAFRGPSSLSLCPIDPAALTALTADDLIDRFLLEENLRIVAEQGEAEEIRTEAELDEEDDLVSEELAEIYLAQGLREEALAIYRKLSLRNPEKSVYFAELIGKLETNN